MYTWHFQPAAPRPFPPSPPHRLTTDSPHNQLLMLLVRAWSWKNYSYNWSCPERSFQKSERENNLKQQRGGINQQCHESCIPRQSPKSRRVGINELPPTSISLTQNWHSHALETIAVVRGLGFRIKASSKLDWIDRGSTTGGRTVDWVCIYSWSY